MGFWAAVPAITSLASSFLKDKKGGETVSQEQMIPQWQRDLQAQLGNYGASALKNFKPGEAYTGELSADMTGQEKSGLDVLNRILALNQPGETFQAAKKSMLDTLSGKYADPNTSPYIQAATKLSNRNLQTSIDTARRSAGTRGQYFTSGAMKNESDLQGKTMDYLNTIIGDYINQERGRQLNMIPQAVSMGQYEDVGLPTAQVDASQRYGGLSRTLEQADLERQYNDWVRGRSEKQTAVGVAANAAGMNQQYGVKNWQTPVTQEDNAMSTILGNVPQLLNIFKTMRTPAVA